MSSSRKSSWQARTPATETPDDSYKKLSFEERLTTYTAGDPLCGYRGLGDWHKLLLKLELFETSQSTAQNIVNNEVAAQEVGGVVAAAELLLLTCNASVD